MVISNERLDEILYNSISDGLLYTKELKIVAHTQYITGCRANDVIEFERWSNVGNNTIRLNPQKGNNFRDFDKSILDGSLVSCIENNVNLFEGLFYRKYQYYMASILGRFCFSLGSKNISTHLFRHNYAKKLKSSGYSDSDIKTMMGERNQVSANQYIYSQIHYVE